MDKKTTPLSASGKNKKIQPGDKFGSWTTTAEKRMRRPSGKAIIMWEVFCACGFMGIVNGYDLLNGKTTKCRCCSGGATADLKDKVFVSWIVLGLSDFKKNGKTYWNCKCSCGHIEDVCAASLTNGVSTRCTQCYFKAMPKHGHCKRGKRHPLYSLWMTMLARCENPKNISWKNYGAKGVRVCERWHILENFAEDMGMPPFPGATIDRIDFNGDYEPSNCRWATAEEQGNNKSTNRNIEYEGVTYNLSQWAKFLNVNCDTLWRYLTRHSFHEAFVHYSKNSKK